MKSSNYIHIHKNFIEAQIDVLFYVEDGITYAYAPALDMLGYGDTQQEAKASFEVVFEDFLEFGLKRGTLIPDLEMHGWQQKKTQEYDLPEAWRLFDHNHQLQQIYSGSFIKESVPVQYAMA